MKALFLTCLFLICWRLGIACDCNSIAGMEKCKTVFRGKVITIKVVEGRSYEYEITFKVQKYLNGKKRTKQLVVLVPCLSEACCGIPFNVGDHYYVFCRDDREDHRLFTNTCTLTQKVSKREKIAINQSSFVH